MAALDMYRPDTARVRDIDPGDKLRICKTEGGGNT
jgi:hypothetical protein